MPANTLDAVGRGVRIAAWGTTGADGNSKTLRIYLGSTAIYNSTGVTTNNGSWYAWAEVRKTGSNTQATVATGIFINSAPATAVTPNAAQTDTSAITIKVTGQNGSTVANDLICNGMTVEMIN
jgi:protocatechuate 3,4-dioxygenase beta subunit